MFDARYVDIMGLCDRLLLHILGVGGNLLPGDMDCNVERTYYIVAGWDTEQ